MRRHPRLVALVALTLGLGLGLGGSVAGAATPNDTSCRKATVSGSPSTTELLAYDACRFDKLDAQLAALRPTSTPTPTASATPSATPTASATPKPSPTPSAASPTASVTPTPAATATAAGAFPSAATTGARGALTKVGLGGITSGAGWQYDSRGFVSAGDNAVLDHLDVPGDIDVTGDNVKITNVKVTESGESFGISIRATATNLLVEDTTIAPPPSGTRLMVGVKEICGDTCPTGTTLRRLDISGVATGVQTESGLLEDSYIHDLRMVDGDHVNGQTSNGGTSTLTIRHNTILNSIGQTDAVSLFQDFGVQANKLVENNLLAGGGYTVYGGAGKAGPSKNIRVVGNQFSTRYFPNAGAYGPVAYYTATDVGNDWSGNTWADGPNGGKPVNP